MIRDLFKANPWVGSDGVLATFGDQGTAANPPPQESSSALRLYLHLGQAAWGGSMPPPQKSPEAQQLSQTAGSQRRASLVQKSSLESRKRVCEDSLKAVARRGDGRKVRSGSESTGWAQERLRVTLGARKAAAVLR